MKKEIVEKMEEISKKEKELNNDILMLEKMLKEENTKKIYNQKNKEEYVYYLQSNGKKETSIHKYLDALEKIRKNLKEFVGIDLEHEIYYIDDLNFFDYVLSSFNESADMKLLNLKHHHMYSAAINNYAKFLKIVK